MGRAAGWPAAGHRLPPGPVRRDLPTVGPAPRRSDRSAQLPGDLPPIAEELPRQLVRGLVGEPDGRVGPLLHGTGRVRAPHGRARPRARPVGSGGVRGAAPPAPAPPPPAPAGGTGACPAAAPWASMMVKPL